MKTEEFFDAVYNCRLSDLDTYNHIKEMTNDFDPKLVNMLCGDFDFYFFMKDEEMLGSVSHEEIQAKIDEYGEKGRKIPMLSDTSNPKSVRHYFKSTKSKFFKVKDDPESKAKREKAFEELNKNSGDSIDVERLMYPTNFFCLYKLRNLLVDLKRKHTSAEYKFDDKPKGSSFNPFEKALNPEQSDTIKLFESVNSGELSKLDIHNRIQQLTDDYDEDKLNLLVEEFDSYIFVKYENWRASYSMDDIEKKVTEWQKRGIKLPMRGNEKNKYHLPHVRNFFLHERYGKPVS